MARTPRRFGVDPRDEGTTGGPRTTPMPPERKEVLRKSEEENARNRRNKPPVEKKAKGGEISNFGKAFRAARERGEKEFTFGKNKEKFHTRQKGESSKAYAAALTAAKSETPVAPPAAKPKTPVAPPAAKPSNTEQARMNLGLGPAGSGGGGPLSFLRRMMSESTENRAKDFAAKQALKKKQQEFDKRAEDTEVPAMLKKAKGGELKKGGKTMMYAKGGKAMKMAKGGSTASKRADGIAVKGKTKGMMPKMAMGGMAVRPGMKKGGKTKGC